MTVYRDVPLRVLPRGHYRAILADPPWRYLTWSDKGMDRSPDRHYPTMTVEELCALPVRALCAPDAVLFLWVIDTHLEIALQVARAWGFTYKTIGFYWAKTTLDGNKFPIGSGHWTRANPEHAYYAEIAEPNPVERLLLNSAGRPKRLNKDVPRLMLSPRREHSRKPDESYKLIERLVAGPYLELFSRTKAPGWDSWGKDAGDHSLCAPPVLHPDAAAIFGFPDEVGDLL